MRNPMHGFTHTALVLLLTGALLQTGCSETDDDPGAAIQQGTLISLADGMVQGEIDGGTRRFFGIPFAQPPLRAPLAAAAGRSLAGCPAAGEMSLPCAQVSSRRRPATTRTGFVNVWTPDPAPTEPLPVMLWFMAAETPAARPGI
jgi:hypothetical protein